MKRLLWVDGEQKEFGELEKDICAHTERPLHSPRKEIVPLYNLCVRLHARPHPQLTSLYHLN